MQSQVFVKKWSDLNKLYIIINFCTSHEHPEGTSSNLAKRPLTYDLIRIWLSNVKKNIFGHNHLCNK